MSSKCNCCSCCHSDVSSNCKSCEPNNDIRIETCAGYGFTTNRCNCACPPQPPTRPLYSSRPCGSFCSNPGIVSRRCGCCPCECCHRDWDCDCDRDHDRGHDCDRHRRSVQHSRKRHHKECGCTNFGSPCPNTTTWGRCE